MPLPSVALDLPAELGPELVASTLTGCNRALGAGRCVVAGEPAEAERKVAWVASLHVGDAAEMAVRIELRTMPLPGALVAARELRFRPSDAPSERWAALGVIVAALVVVQENAVSPAKSGEEHPPSEPVQPPPKEAVQRSSAPKDGRRPPPPRPDSFELRLDLAALAGPGFVPESWRIGGQVRVATAWQGSPFFGWTALTAARHDGSVSAVWSSAAMGLGVRGTTGGLAAFDGRVGGIGTLVNLQAESGVASDHASRWRWGSVVALDLVILASRHLHSVVSFEATASWPRVVVNKENSRVGQEPIIGWAVLGGLRWIP